MYDNDNRLMNFCGVSGLKRGVVTDTNDPDNLNKVKVLLPDEGIEVGYAPVLSLFAGEKRGVVFSPLKDEEVLVGFFDGKINNPVVLGGLYNSKNKPPMQIDSKNEMMMVQLPTGLKIEINTNESSSNILITTKNGHVIDLEDGNSQAALLAKEKDGKTLFNVDFKNGSIELKAEKNISLEAGNNEASFKIDSKKGFTFSSQSGDFNTKVKNNSLKASANNSLEANGSSKLKSNASVTIDANAMASIKGSILKLN